jgi:hypothetical protein
VENNFVPIDLTVIVDIVRRRLDPSWFYLVHFILFRDIYTLFFIISMSRSSYKLENLLFAPPILLFLRAVVSCI